MKKKASQKLTETSTTVEQLLKGTTITPEQLAGLSRAEKDLLADTLTKQFNSATVPTERDRLWGLIETNAPAELRRDYYESNHRQIVAALVNYLNEFGHLPTKQRLSDITKLSRQTIYKHLRDYKESSSYLKEQQELLELLGEQLISKVLAAAWQGDIRAAKLFFELTGRLKSASGTTTNYVQINNTIFSQESLSQLPPEQLAEVEKLLHQALSR